MKKALIIILSVIFLIVILVSSFYALFMYSVIKMYKKQQVAENVQVTSEWFEITPEQPLKITKQVQSVQLLIEGYKHDVHKDDFGNIQLTDGTYINPEVEIVDENGKTYQLKDGRRSGDLIGFSPNKEIHGTPYFTKDVTYKTIRIRSDKTFICKKIIWYDYDLK